jgi:hypothetical protein
MRQLSSNWTMAFGIFFPTLWLAFFGTFLIAIVLTDKDAVGTWSINSLRFGLAAFVGIFVFIFWKTLFRLKRIDADNEFVYVTNFFKAVRYPHADVEKIEVDKGLIFTFGTVVLRGEGRFGKRLLFLCSRRRLEVFTDENPELKEKVMDMSK